MRGEGFAFPEIILNCLICDRGIFTFIAEDGH